MKDQYAGNLQSGDIVQDKFILSKKILKEKKDGGLYALLEFTDQSGRIEGIAWDNVVDSLTNIARGDFVELSGTVNEYNNRLQITVSSIRRISGKDLDPQDFLPRTDKDIDKIVSEINVFRTRIRNPYLKKLLKIFFDDKKFVQMFRTAPAAISAHHAYLGGLALHTLRMCKLVMHVQSVYDWMDIDLLITGVILHDIGKLVEYGYSKTIQMTTVGKLLGHIAIGYNLIAQKIDMVPDFPVALRNKVLHMILSHHGELEWGSPRVPMFPEALVLHYVDDLDAKVEMMKSTLDKHRETEQEWSDHHRFLDREIYLD